MDLRDRNIINEKLWKVVEQGRLIIGAGVGSGFAAKYAEEGGADLLFLFNSGRFRMAGVPSLAGYLPYANANDMVISFGVSEIIPKVKNVPVIAGLCATDPKYSHEELLEKIKNYSFSGVVNYPTLSIIDGNFRLVAEEQGLGFENEVNLIVSTTGGVGTVPGVLAGVLIFGVINYGLTFIGINPYWQYILKGIVIVVAVSIDIRKYLTRK